MSAGPIVVALVGILLITVAGWTSWRRPTALLAVALASLSVRPQLFYGGAAVGYEWGLHHTLLLLALLVNALRFGLRRGMYWPLAGLVAAFALSLAVGDPHPKLSLGFMVMSLGVFALPWGCTSVVLEPGSRRILALVIMLTPLLSVAVGAFMSTAGIRSTFPNSWRLEGATGNAAAFALLAFTGFVVALHEMPRPNRPFVGALAILNLALVILSGTRMAIAASGVFLVAYLAFSETLRQRLWSNRIRTASSAVMVVAVFLWYWPTLEGRLFEYGDLQAAVRGDATAVNLSGRDDIWQFYFEEFTFSPLFGRGIGAGFVAAADWLPGPRKTPHNEYLHLLVNLGVVGLILFAAALVVWYRRLLQMAPDSDRTFLYALMPSAGLFAVTEDVLVFSTGLALFAYLDVLLTKRSPKTALPPGRKRRNGSLWRRATRERSWPPLRGSGARARLDNGGRPRPPLRATFASACQDAPAAVIARLRCIDTPHRPDQMPHKPRPTIC